MQNVSIKSHYLEIKECDVNLEHQKVEFKVGVQVKGKKGMAATPQRGMASIHSPCAWSQGAAKGCADQPDLVQRVPRMI